jgi:type III secretion protein L
VDRRLSLRGLGILEAAPHGVIPAARIEEAEAATTLLEDAEREAAAIRAGAQEALEEARAQGRREGLEAAAREAAARLLAEGAALDEALAALEGRLAELVAGCVRQVVGEIDRDELIDRTVATALGAVRSQRRLRLYVARAAAEPARAAVVRCRDDFPEIELVDVIEDPLLQVPDLRIESDLGVVHFVLDNTLADLGAVLSGRR